MSSPSAPRRWQLICRDLPIDVDFPVRTWDEHGHHFRGRHRTLTLQVVNHTTGSENPPATVFHTLSERDLSVHFVVDAGGVVYQMADTELRASHCPEINVTSIGIEFVCRHSAIKLPARGIVRRLTKAVIHDAIVPHYELTDAQVRTGVKLNRALCNLYGLPFKVPLAMTGDVYPREMNDKLLKNFAGCVGHFHAQRQKTDPGLGILRAIRDAGKADLPAPP